MRINGLIYRFFRFKENKLKVHLGCGKRNYLNGWLNLDANIFTAKCDLWVNLADPLPFPDGSVDAFYSHHVVEHLTDIKFHFNEIRRCLKTGGVYRVGAPNGDSAIQKFVEKDLGWFSDYPDKRSSIGGRLDNLIFCRNEHFSLITLSFLEELCEESGLEKPKLVLPSKETGSPLLFNDCLLLEDENDFNFPHTLIVEAEKKA